METPLPRRRNSSRDYTYRDTTACTAKNPIANIAHHHQRTASPDLRVGKSAYPTSDFAAINVLKSDILIPANRAA